MNDKKQIAAKLKNTISQLNKEIKEAEEIGLTITLSNIYNSDFIKQDIDIKIEERILM